MDRQELLLTYVDYMKSADLEKVQIKTIPHSVDNGVDTAKSFWNAEYVDGGVKVTVDVIDENVSIDESNKGYSDNIEFQMQAVDNLWQAKDYSINFLCDASGRYWIRRYVPNSYTDITLDNDPTIENNELYYVSNVTDTGYQVEVFVSYDILNVTEEEAKGNIRICPMLRNRTDASHNVCETSSLLGCYYHIPTTWFVLNENNLFTRTDLEEFTLSSRNAEASEMIANMASLQAEDGGVMAKTESGAHYRENDNMCFDGIARDLIGTDYVLTSSANKKATVTEEGYVIICVREDNKTLMNNLASAGWKLIADKCRTAMGQMAGTSYSSFLTTSYYAKYCTVNETIATTGDYSVVFGKASADTPEAIYKNKPAYISFEAVNDAYALKVGYEDVFSNLAHISANNGSMKIVVDKGNMIADRLTQNYTFQTAEAKFLEGKAYTYANMDKGAFTVQKSGYVFLVVPGGSGSSLYPTLRNNVSADGWTKLFTDWNKMGSLSDPICYYVKWCEAGETYSYGKFNIAVADPASVK